MDSPWFTFNDVALNVGTAGATSAEFTVTAEAAEEVPDSGAVAPSVTT
jgi:hypothetical protein